MGRRVLSAALRNAARFGYFFGPIHWFVLGIWRKNLAFLGIVGLITLVEVIVEIATDTVIPTSVDRGLGVGLSVLWGLSTKYSYYLTRVKGSKSRTPFEGMRWI